MSLSENGKEKDKKKMKDSLIVAYYLSRKNKTAIDMLGYDSFKSAFYDIGKILHQKPSVIKMMRDEFDPYFDNGRVGWYQRELSPSRAEVFNELMHYNDDELLVLVKNILESNKKTVPTNKSENGHTILRINSKGMKEVKTKK